MADIAKIQEIGNAWTHSKTGAIRYYINDWQDMIGLEVEYYKTGNVSDVTFKGEDRSNSWFKRYVAGTKVWVSETGEIHVEYCNEEEVESAIIEALNALMDDAEEEFEIVSEGSEEIGGVAYMEIHVEDHPFNIPGVRCICGKIQDFGGLVLGGNSGLGMRKGLDLDLWWDCQCGCGEELTFGVTGRADQIHYGDSTTEWTVDCDSDFDVFLGCPYCDEEFNVFLNIPDGDGTVGKVESDKLRLDWDVPCPHCSETIEIGLSAPISATCLEAPADEYPEDMTIGEAFCFTCDDGRSGMEYMYRDLDEAMEAAESKWASLTPKERRVYSDPDRDSIFGVSRCMNGLVVEDIKVWECDEEPIEEWSGTVKITAHGNSLDIKVTDAARAMGLDRGDYVEVTIRRK